MSEPEKPQETGLSKDFVPMLCVMIFAMMMMMMMMMVVVVAYGQGVQSGETQRQRLRSVTAELDRAKQQAEGLEIQLKRWQDAYTAAKFNRDFLDRETAK